MQINLSELKIGVRGIIITIEECDIRKSLIEMGFIPNTAVVRLRTAPLSDPMEFKLRGFKISLRRSEAENIIVEVDS